MENDDDEEDDEVFVDCECEPYEDTRDLLYQQQLGLSVSEYSLPMQHNPEF